MALKAEITYEVEHGKFTTDSNNDIWKKKGWTLMKDIKISIERRNHLLMMDADI